MPRGVCVTNRIEESRDVQRVPFSDSANKRQGSATPSREKSFPNKVLARQQAKFVSGHRFNRVCVIE